MQCFQVDYRIQRDGFEQVEAESEEDAIQKITSSLDGEGEILTSEA